MDKMKSKSATLVFFIIWFIYIAFFSFIITVIREDGYLNFEPLFISSHVSTLFSGGELVKNFFLSYPLLTNLLTYPFSIFGPVDAPFFASVFYMSLLATTVVTIVGHEKNNVIKGLLFLYFLCSPVTIYAATSGTAVYAFFTLYFLIFYYLFNYIKKFTTYHITILSIILSLAVFLDYRILWILLLLLLYAFVFSIYGVKGLQSANIIIKYVKITQHRSLRRKLRGRVLSMVFIIGFFPVTTLLLYLFVNYLMGNDFFYFYDSLETKWNGNSFFSLLEPDTLVGLKNRTVNDFSFLYIVIFLMPIYLFELVVNYKKGLKVFILLLAPILLHILVRDSLTDYMSLSYYTILIACGLASMATSGTMFKQKKVSYLFYACLFAVSIYGEYSYLKKSAFTSEQVFYKSVIEKEQNSILLEYKKAGEFLAYNTAENTVVLSDRSVLYPIIAYNNHNNIFISNSSEEFEKAVYNPNNHCDYIILTNTNSPYHFLDKVNANLEKNKNNRYSRYAKRNEVVYYSKTFSIIKVVK